MNTTAKVVFSGSLTNASWDGTRVVKRVNGEEINGWKQGPGKDMAIVGSASIVHEFIKLDLIDGYQLMIHPLAIGDGKSLFNNFEKRQNLKLTRTKALSNGVVVLHYELKR